jgi:cysteine desulfurase family protein (TIGR01976 family)
MSNATSGAPARDHAAVRARFPALTAPDRDTVFLDNAGGAQVPQALLDRTIEAFRRGYAQLGGTYPASQRSAAAIAAARSFLRTFVHGDDIGEVVLGPSTSALCLALADAHARASTPARRARQRIVVCTGGHESNVGPWLRLADRGFEVVEVGMRRATDAYGEDDLEIDHDALARALDERTRLVAVHHVSNLLGRIEDVSAISRAAHEVGAEVVVDGVAFAPHRAPDVVATGADWYVLSTYKVYGPHMAMLFGRREAFEGLVGSNHFFVADDAIPGKFELGGVDHEACAGMLGVRDHFAWLAGGGDRVDESIDRATIERASETMRLLEQPAMDAMTRWLADRSGESLRTIGPVTSDPDVRMPTFSFVARDARYRSADLAREANAEGLGLRFGHFYSHRLASALGLDLEDGVVRASFVHYNDRDEVERMIDWLDRRLTQGVRATQRR